MQCKLSHMWCKGQAELLKRSSFMIYFWALLLTLCELINLMVQRLYPKLAFAPPLSSSFPSGTKMIHRFWMACFEYRRIGPRYHFICLLLPVDTLQTVKHQLWRRTISRGQWCCWCLCFHCANPRGIALCMFNVLMKSICQDDASVSLASVTPC